MSEIEKMLQELRDVQAKSFKLKRRHPLNDKQIEQLERLMSREEDLYQELEACDFDFTTLIKP